MTIGVGWIRGDGGEEELWIASDSRLSGDGNIWDECPKLFLLPRRDTVAAFSGSTAQAYPLLIQFANAIHAYHASATGVLELFDLLGHLERVAVAMLGSLTADPRLTGTPGRPEFSSSGDVLLVGGFSRKQQGLVLRALTHERSAQGWTFTHVRPTRSLGRRRTIRIFGDHASRSKYRYHLKQLLKQRGNLSKSQPFDLEPLETLAAFLRMPATDARPLPNTRRPMTVGGPPQVARVMAGADSVPFVVRWEEKHSPAEFLLGRRCFPYERIDLPLISFTDEGHVSICAPGRWSPTNSGSARAIVAFPDNRDQG